jgi:sugar/nucleoside kinase (ribokinase family)
MNIVFANESEIISFFEVNDLKSAVKKCQKYKNVFAITCAEKGSIIVDSDAIIKVNAIQPSMIVDTTGAGDMYAAGFLHGYLAGRDLKTCGIMGSISASEVISHYGARLHKPLYKVFKDMKLI